YDQRAQRRTPRSRAAGAMLPLPQRRDRISHVSQLERGQQAESTSAENRQTEAEGEDTRVYMEIGYHASKRVRLNRIQKPQHRPQCVRQKKACAATQERQCEPF